MRKLFGYLTLAIACFMTVTAHAQTYTQGDITLSHVWARATGAGTSAELYATFTNNSGAEDGLYSVSADSIADRIDLSDGNNKSLDFITIPNGKTVTLSPGGYHVTLMNIKRPLKAGESFPALIQYEGAGQVRVTVAVEAANATAPSH